MAEYGTMTQWNTLKPGGACELSFLVAQPHITGVEVTVGDREEVPLFPVDDAVMELEVMCVHIV